MKILIVNDFGYYLGGAETGFLVPPHDIEALSEKIVYVLDNRDILKKIGDNLIDSVSGLRSSIYAEKLEAIYNTL